MGIDKSLVSGSMTMLILKLLSEKDMYGYEMIDTLREKSQNVFELKAGDTAQNALKQIDDKGYAIPYQTDGRRVVKVGVSMNAETRTVENWETDI